LYQPGWKWKVLVVDVDEMEIERPKKTETLLLWQAQMPHYEGTTKEWSLKLDRLLPLQQTRAKCRTLSC